MTVAIKAFRPDPKSTVILAVTAASQALQVRTNNNSRHLRVYNPSATVIVFVEFSNNSGIVATTTTGMPVPPGGVEIFSGVDQYIAAIGSAAGPTNVYFTPGEGL